VFVFLITCPPLVGNAKDPYDVDSTDDRIIQSESIRGAQMVNLSSSTILQMERIIARDRLPDATPGENI